MVDEYIPIKCEACGVDYSFGGGRGREVTAAVCPFKTITIFSLTSTRRGQ